LKATVAELKGRGVKFDDAIADRGYGLVTHFTMPGGVKVQLYQPHHEKRARKTARKAAPAPKRRAEALR
jgi:hypothetical protein